jgi:hypothetical protein
MCVEQDAAKVDSARGCAATARTGHVSEVDVLSRIPQVMGLGHVVALRERESMVNAPFRAPRNWDTGKPMPDYADAGADSTMLEMRTCSCLATPVAAGGSSSIAALPVI